MVLKFRGIAAPTCSLLYTGGETDPYFTGFTGQSFYLSAEAGNVYNLFSEQVGMPYLQDELYAEHPKT